MREGSGREVTGPEELERPSDVADDVASTESAPAPLQGIAPVPPTPSRSRRRLEERFAGDEAKLQRWQRAYRTLAGIVAVVATESRERGWVDDADPALDLLAQKLAGAR